MDNLKTYPDESDLSPVTKTYPIKKAASQKFVADRTMSEYLLHELQLAVFHAKMDLIKFILENEMVPTSDDSVEIEIRVKRRAVSAEATNGEWISLPVETHTLRTYEYKGLW